MGIRLALCVFAGLTIVIAAITFYGAAVPLSESMLIAGGELAAAAVLIWISYVVVIAD